MTITLPLPDARLSPNARCHWAKKSTITRRHVRRAAAATMAALGGRAIPSFSGYTLAFFFPNAIRRDDDNAAASCKAYRDGIAKALCIDDHGLRMAAAPSIQIDRINPRLEITLTLNDLAQTRRAGD
jgi:hypothetical protein